MGDRVKRVVTYLAADKQAGFTVEELREALARATSIEYVWYHGISKRKLWRIDVEEPADPNVKIGLS
jgi:hypothetical protein